MAPSPEVVAKTAALLEERYGCAVCGAIDGFTVAAPEAVARHLLGRGPDLPSATLCRRSGSLLTRSRSARR
jgi:hypothetical protein